MRRSTPTNRALVAAPIVARQPTWQDVCVRLRKSCKDAHAATADGRKEIRERRTIIPFPEEGGTGSEARATEVRPAAGRGTASGAGSLGLVTLASFCDEVGELVLLDIGEDCDCPCKRRVRRGCNVRLVRLRWTILDALSYKDLDGGTLTGQQIRRTT